MGREHLFDSSGYRKAYSDWTPNRLGNFILKCSHCGKEFHSYSRRRRYCSYRCRNDAWIQRRKTRRETARLKLCKYCGKQFKAKRKDAKFCCASHRVLTFYKQREA